MFLQVIIWPSSQLDLGLFFYCYYFLTRCVGVSRHKQKRNINPKHHSFLSLFAPLLPQPHFYHFILCISPPALPRFSFFFFQS